MKSIKENLENNLSLEIQERKLMKLSTIHPYEGTSEEFTHLGVTSIKTMIEL